MRELEQFVSKIIFFHKFLNYKLKPLPLCVMVAKLCLLCEIPPLKISVKSFLRFLGTHDKGARVFYQILNAT